MLQGLIRNINFFDRRQFRRYKVEKLVEGYCLYEESGQAVRCFIVVKNFSKGGILVVTGKNKIMPETLVSLEFRLPSRETPLSIPGKVVRTYRHHMESFYRSGIKFSKSHSDEAREFLSSILNKK